MLLVQRLKLLRHTSGRNLENVASLDRYTTIRNFFRQYQTVCPGSGISPPLRTNTSAGRYCSGFVGYTQTSLTIRCFSQSSRLYEEDKQRSKSQSDQDQGPKSESGGNDPGQSAETRAIQNLENYPPFFRRLAMSLPHLHRPTKDDFLKAANGFWQRARVRFRWITIRSFRKYNADDISAFITWMIMSQTLWLFVGTTTFFSVVFATANSLRLQEDVARIISNYLTAETGITIRFESAVVPKWKDSRLSFKNVFVTYRPPDGTRKKNVEKHAGHWAAAGYDVSNHPSYHHLGDEDDDGVLDIDPPEDWNYSMFDLNIDSIDVTLSLARWLDGKGLVKDAVVKGVRGVLDRRSVHWDPDNPPDPASFRHSAKPGDFELDSFQLEDVLITVYQPGNFRPYTASIFRADIGAFRKQWLFYDFLCAENVVGQFDNCLFSLHRPQSIGRTTDRDLKDGQWARMSRFRMDGLNIDHLQAMTTEEGPISWITSGKVDAVFDIKFPSDPQEGQPLNAFLEELADAISSAASSAVERIPGQRELAKPALSAPSDVEEARGRASEVDAEHPPKPKVVIDIDLRFRDLKAAVPLFSNDLSYVNSALIRPIVAFMNANRTLVPIRCRVIKDLSEFDGAWTMWETGLMDAVAIKVYDAMAYHVTQANFNRRIRAVSAWSMQMTASAVLSALRNLLDPMAVQLREIYDQRFPYDATFQIPADLVPVV